MKYPLQTEFTLPQLEIIRCSLSTCCHYDLARIFESEISEIEVILEAEQVCENQCKYCGIEIGRHTDFCGSCGML